MKQHPQVKVNTFRWHQQQLPRVTHP